MSLFHIDAGREWRGGQRQSFFLAKELKRNGYSFRFVVQPKSPLHQKAVEAGLPVFPVKISSEIDALSILRLSLSLKRKKCQLISYQDARSAAVASAAAALAKIPIRVISRHVDFLLKKSASSRRKYAKNVDAIIAVSEGSKYALVEGGVDAKLIHVIPDGIDFAPYEDKTSKDYLRHEFSFAPEDFLVGIMTPLSDDKGHKYLIQVSKQLREHSPKIKIIIMGEGPLQLELSERVKEIQEEDMVFFLGFWENIPHVFNSLDVFTLNSDREGLGTIIRDAMACRLPVVGTRVGEILDWVSHQKTGLLVQPQRPKSLAKAILRIYEDKELALRLGQKGYEEMHEEFSAESMALRTIDLFEKLAKKKGINFLKNT